MFTQVGTARGGRSPKSEGSLKGMTGKNTRGLILCAALAAAAFGATACGDSSTATAPLTQDATIATMSGHASANSASAANTASQSADSSEGAAASSSAEEAASKATTELPATKPKSTTTGSGTGAQDGGESNGRTLSQKEKNYLAALKRDDVAFMGDDDNAVALAWGHYVCREQGKNTDPSVIKVYIRAGIGPTTQSDQEAGAKADKLIAAADKNLC